jgi:hypothetical protein
MTPAALAWRRVVRRPAATLLSVLLIALGVAAIAAMLLVLRISVDENRFTDLANAACWGGGGAIRACLPNGSVLACLQRAALLLRAIW